jgi:hypothetical protein
LLPFITRETVMTDMPASLATSDIVLRAPLATVSEPPTSFGLFMSLFMFTDPWMTLSPALTA